MNYLENVASIALPKGENKQVALNWLENNGLKIPECPARCLHLAR